MYLYIPRIKVTFTRKRRKKAIPRSMLFRASYHSRGTTTNAGAKVFFPLELSLFPLPALGLRSTPPYGSGFALSAVTVLPPPVASAAQWLHCFFSAATFDLCSQFALLAVTVRPANCVGVKCNFVSLVQLLLYYNNKKIHKKILQFTY